MSNLLSWWILWCIGDYIKTTFFCQQILTNIELVSWSSDASNPLGSQRSVTEPIGKVVTLCLPSPYNISKNKETTKQKNGPESPQLKDKPNVIYDLVQHFVKQCSFQNKCFQTISSKRMAQVTSIKQWIYQKRSATKCSINVLGKSFK